MTSQHKELASGRWRQLSFLEQMANVGSEVERYLTWRAKGRPDLAQRAFERALELIDLTLDAHRDFPRLREVARARELLADFHSDTPFFRVSENSWRNYFRQFGYAARNTAGRTAVDAVQP